MKELEYIAVRHLGHLNAAVNELGNIAVANNPCMDEESYKDLMAKLYAWQDRMLDHVSSIMEHEYEALQGGGVVNEADRIRLAEAMGWVRASCGSTEYIWVKHGEVSKGMCPDPFTDANDCEALIRHLNEAGYFLYVGWRDGAAIAEIKRADGTFVDEWAGDDYKQGVCELALKVLSDE